MARCLIKQEAVTRVDQRGHVPGDMHFDRNQIYKIFPFRNSVRLQGLEGDAVTISSLTVVK
jgi:hypothetical protein